MPLNAAGMSSEILALVKTANTAITPAEEAIITPLLDKICEGIVAHILANAVVTVAVSGGSSSGSHTGAIT